MERKSGKLSTKIGENRNFTKIGENRNFHIVSMSSPVMRKR